MAMTQQQIQQFIEATDSRLAEYFDGYVVVGFVAGTSQPVIIRSASDPKTALGLKSLLHDAVVAQETRPDGD